MCVCVFFFQISCLCRFRCSLFALISQDADHLFFCYRWFLIDFKRDFVSKDSLLMLETIWASRVCGSLFFAIFVGYSILQIYKDKIMQAKSHDDLLLFFNAQQGLLSVELVLAQARKAMTEVRNTIKLRDLDV